MKERKNEFQQAVGRPFYLERVARVTCDVGYLCAKFSLPGPVCSRIGHNVRDRQTDVKHAWLLNAPTLMAGDNNESSKTSYHWYQKCVYPCGNPHISTQDHPVRTNKQQKLNESFCMVWCPLSATSEFISTLVLLWPPIFPGQCQIALLHLDKSVVFAGHFPCGWCHRSLQRLCWRALIAAAHR